MNLTYFIRGVELGTVQFPQSSPFPTTNLTFFCADCGKTWGRIRRPPSTTWRVVYRSCGCYPHGALCLFEPGLFEQIPYQEKLGDYREWMNAFERWPDALVKYEFETLLRNCENGRYYDTPRA